MRILNAVQSQKWLFSTLSPKSLHTDTPIVAEAAVCPRFAFPHSKDAKALLGDTAARTWERQPVKHEALRR